MLCSLCCNEMETWECWETETSQRVPLGRYSCQRQHRAVCSGPSLGIQQRARNGFLRGDQALDPELAPITWQRE